MRVRSASATTIGLASLLLSVFLFRWLVLEVYCLFSDFNYTTPQSNIIPQLLDDPSPSIQIKPQSHRPLMKSSTQ